MNTSSTTEAGASTFPELLGTASKNNQEIKLASLFKRIVSSPLFWSTLAALSGTLLTFVALLTPPLGLPVSIIGVVATIIFAGVSAFAIAKRKQLFYETSLAYNFIYNKISPETCPVYSKITDNLFLGRLPLKNRNDHCTLIDQENIGAILSVVEHFENHTLGILSDPVTSEDWATLGIDQKQIETKDFHPLSAEDIAKGVAFIEKAVNKGKKVYVHCKAGRSRSAAIVVAYLAHIKMFNTVEEAVAFVKERRPVIKLNPEKNKPIQEFLDKQS